MSIDDLKRILDYIQQYSASTWITFAAVVFGAVCLRALYRVPSDRPPPHGERARSAKVPRWPLPCSVGALLIIVAAQGLSWWSANYLPTTTPRQAFVALQENKRVSWLIRLIPYSSHSETSLSIHELATLGPPADKFVFVADYDELKNLTVSEAIYRLGLSLKNKDSASAIIFPLNRRELIPANARGLLQIIQELDKEMKDSKDYKIFDLTRELDKTALAKLAADGLESWSWNAYSEYYDQYSAAVEKARDSNASAFKFIGTIGPDWHPAGYSKIISPDSNHDGTVETNFNLVTMNKHEVKIDNFGARVFLVENLRLRDIDHIFLIHFSNLDTDRIPEIRGRNMDTR